MPKTRLTLLGGSCLIALSALLLGAGTAAAQRTLGWTPTARPNTALCSGTPFDAIQAEVSDRSISYVAPTAGVITSWSTWAAVEDEQQLTFKVFRPNEDFEYTVVTADLRSLAPGVLNTFPVSIPVRRGDLIGLQSTSSSITNSPARPSPAAKKTRSPLKRETPRSAKRSNSGCRKNGSG